MAIELKIPEVGESIAEVELGAWLRQQGDTVHKDEILVTLESEKATVDLPAPQSGTLTRILKQKGAVAKVGEVIALLEPGGAQATTSEKPIQKKNAGAKPEPAKTQEPAAQARVMPAAQIALAEQGLSAADVQGSGPGGRILKEDVLRHRESRPQPEMQPASAPSEPDSPAAPQAATNDREEEVVPMSRLRRTVAERLVQAQHSAALLTTFNEIDMSSIMGLRKEYGDSFQQKYQVKLGFMSFFVKACVDALKQFPALNAEVRESNIVYHNYYDIGVAIGGGKGLVVPVLRSAERMSFAEIEKVIGDFARRAKENKLKVDELQGGTFTISNGGVYGSLLSTPIVNPPQSGILGLHAIQDRPVARDGNVVVRPMMYVALTYDHRLVDGREAVSFLKRVKDVIENPSRMLMEV
ncbi:MAG TPA: 2-oxoglutarate dehydrogenase complex dihydrolipoyllysine-residue succinyltransferase [Candidatus Limnocylindrales bacterium]|nr:2-oxoglutarate dehydrogenase complex dihydrolipoyllysine-residue succinyltransferase [Candidatus Limnocylindrales bacterium]